MPGFQRAALAKAPCSPPVLPQEQLLVASVFHSQLTLVWVLYYSHGGFGELALNSTVICNPISSIHSLIRPPVLGTRPGATS